MAVDDIIRVSGPYTGNGVFTDLPFNFAVLDPADVVVARQGNGPAAADLSFTIHLNSGSVGGFARLSEPLPTEEVAYVVGFAPRTQGLVLENQGAFHARDVMRALDRTVILVQELGQVVDRALRLPVGSSANPELPTPLANTAIGWSPQADRLVNLGDLQVVPAAGLLANTTTFTADGGTGPFTLSAPVSVGKPYVHVSAAGLRVPQDDYAVLGDQLTFTPGRQPLAGDPVEVVAYGAVTAEATVQLPGQNPDTLVNILTTTEDAIAAIDDALLVIDNTLLATDNTIGEIEDATAVIEGKLQAIRGETVLDSAVAADNDAAFAALATAYPGSAVDLRGRTIPVTEVPTGLRVTNGFFLRVSPPGTIPALLPAFGTLDWRETIIDAGKNVLGWPQDSCHTHNGLLFIGANAADDGHRPGTLPWALKWSRDQGVSCSREEAHTFGLASRVTVWGAAAKPGAVPSASPHQMAIVTERNSADQSTGLRLYARRLAEYKQAPGGGGLVNPGGESAWSETLFGGANLGAALRAACDAEFSVTTSGVPTLVHAMALDGAALSTGDFFSGFHNLTGLAAGPYLIRIGSAPYLGAAGTVDWVARIGGLTQGVEPCVAWYKNGAEARLAGFIRNQGSSYPMRFWTAPATKAGVAGAAVQGCPWGNEVGMFSPLPCRMRPRRRGTFEAWHAGAGTLDGSETDELHFCFTGDRQRTQVSNLPGPVSLYWGRVTRGPGDFADMWERARVTKIAELYFANSNVGPSTQVGAPSLCFSDANTLHIITGDEAPAIKDDYDESFLRVITIRLHDDYADAASSYDDGVARPTFTQRATEFAEY